MLVGVSVKCFSYTYFFLLKLDIKEQILSETSYSHGRERERQLAKIQNS